MKISKIACVLFLAVGATVAQERYPLTELRADLESFVSDRTLSNAFIGMEVKSLRTGEIIFRHNADMDFVPASNMKLITTATALSTLGPDYQYRTLLMANGYISADTLFGDLYIVGSGDPTISGRFNGGNVLQAFEDWADTLKLLNIDVVKGNIIGDNRCFDNIPIGEGWALSWHENIYWYAAQISGLSYNDNCIDLTIGPGRIGQPAVYSINPETNYVKFVNSSVTIGDSANTIDFHREPGTEVIDISGDFPSSLDSLEVPLAVNNPANYTADVFAETLGTEHIMVIGKTEDISEYERSHRVPPYSLMWEVASYTSPPLSEIVKVTNKRSQNLYAEQIFRTLGLVKYGLGSLANSRKVEQTFLNSIGVDTSTVEIHDGSGLSAFDLVTPDAIVRILAAMYRGDGWRYYYDSLPVAGVDGTLEFRMRGTKAEGNVHAKTGYIQNVRSLSGYLTTADGEPIAFSIFVNHFTTGVSAVNNLQDVVCTRLCNFSRR